MSAGESEADHPRFFVGADEGEGDELLDPGRVLGYDCLYENVEEEEEEDEEEYDSVSDQEKIYICIVIYFMNFLSLSFSLWLFTFLSFVLAILHDCTVTTVNLTSSHLLPLDFAGVK